MLVFAPSVTEPERLAGLSQGLSYHGCLFELDFLGSNSSPVFPVGGHCRVTFQSAHMKEYGYLRVSGGLLLRCRQSGAITADELSPLMYRALT